MKSFSITSTLSGYPKKPPSLNSTDAIRRMYGKERAKLDGADSLAPFCFIIHDSIIVRARAQAEVLCRDYVQILDNPYLYILREGVSLYI